MILAPHILVSTAVAANVPNPLIGLFLAFAIHFILDKIPHWEYSIEPLKEIKTRGLSYCMPILRRVFLDMFIGGLIAVITILVSKSEMSLFVAATGGFLGILPDGMSALHFLKPQNRFLKIFFDFHQKIHFSKKNGSPPLRIGLTWQIAASILAVYFLMF